MVVLGMGCGLCLELASLARASTEATEPAETMAQDAAQPPAARASPAAKDDYVNGQLTKLFQGWPGRVSVRRVFDDWLIVDVSATDAAVSSGNVAAGYSVGLFACPNESEAHRNVQEEWRNFPAPTTLSKPGYDECYSNGAGRMAARRGSLVIIVFSSPAGGADTLLAVLGKNIAAAPSLLPDLVHYAYSMHFGDIAPLKAAMEKLGVTVAGLSAASFPPKEIFGPNSVTANYTDAGGGTLRIEGKAYDSVAAAKAGLDQDMMMVSVGPDATKTVQGANVYEYKSYNGMRFQAGCYTFVFDGKPWMLLQQAFSALVADLAPPPK